ncbi:MAG: hypothetical protein V3S24_16475 [Candidatus Tectomicrobia bacterium]
MLARFVFPLLLSLAIFDGGTSAIADDDTESLTRADRFAFEVLNPSMDFVWRSHRIRQKLLARLGIPDEMELHTQAARTSDQWLAAEIWNYVGGPRLKLYSNDNEWIESITIPINTQIALPFGLYVGAPRSDFLEKLELEVSDDRPSRPIGYETNLRTTFGYVSITVIIEFDENGNSTQVKWTSYDD